MEESPSFAPEQAITGTPAIKSTGKGKTREPGRLSLLDGKTPSQQACFTDTGG